MNKLIGKLLYVFFLFPIITNAQNSYSDKIVNLPAGRSTLKAILGNLSRQTGCIFSYDPIKIDDKQELTVPRYCKLSLQAALQKILPRTIHFKFREKYVVLQRTDLAKLTTSPKALKSQSHPIKVVGIPVASETKAPQNVSVESTAAIANSIPESSALQQTDSTQISIPDPVLTAIARTDTVSKKSIASIPADTAKVVKQRSKFLFEIELAENKHLATFSTHIGLNNLYSIISAGSDYYKSYHVGVGAGASFKLYKHLGANIDLIQYALVGGRTSKLKVKTNTTQLSPMLTYSIGQRLKLFAGYSIYRITSRYVKGGSNIDLGKSTGYSAMLGIKINLSKPSKINI
jgi:hypothetical protein